MNYNKMINTKVKLTPQGQLRYDFGGTGVNKNLDLFVVRFEQKAPKSKSRVYISNSLFNERFGMPDSRIQVTLEDVEFLKDTISDFEKLIEEKQKELEEIQKKIDYLKENNLESFDEDEYKIFCLLEVLESKEHTKNQKVMLIKEII